MSVPVGRHVSLIAVMCRINATSCPGGSVDRPRICSGRGDIEFFESRSRKGFMVGAPSNGPS